MTYQSRMLREYHNEDGYCPVCQFVAGDHSPAILEAVIQRLDAKLAQREQMCDDLVRRLIDLNPSPCGE